MPQIRLITPHLKRILSTGDAAKQRLARAKRAYRNLKIDSLVKLLNAYRDLEKDAGFVAILIFKEHDYREAVPLLFEELASPDGEIAGIASVALGALADHAVIDRLVIMLEDAQSLPSKLNVLSALCHVRDATLAIAVSKRLLLLLDDSTEPAESRSMAAEGLAWLLEAIDDAKLGSAGGENDQLRQRVSDSLISALGDESPLVRSCAIYAVGQLGLTAAIDVLERMALTEKEGWPGVGPLREQIFETLDFIRASEQDSR